VMSTFSGLPVGKIPRDCFIARSFVFGPCPCGNFKLVAFDAAGVERALVAMEAWQVSQMAATCAAYSPGAAPPGDETAKETKH
jgi:hypothetical protein